MIDVLAALPRPCFQPTRQSFMHAFAVAGIVGAALVLVGAADPLFQLLSRFALGWPILIALWLLPSVVAYWCLSTLLRWLRIPVAAAFSLAALPFLIWAAGVAPAMQARALAAARADGGALPIFAQGDVVAIVDRTAPNHINKTHCLALCVEILRSGTLGGIFLPRAAPPDGPMLGVIYRRVPFGQECDQELHPRGARALCVSISAATLSRADYVLESRFLTSALEGSGIGLISGEQILITHAASGRILRQETSFVALVPHFIPLLRDFRNGQKSWPSMLTRTVQRDWQHPPLLNMLYTALISQPN